MGKKLRQTNVSGLSRFLQVLDQPNSLSSNVATTNCSTPTVEQSQPIHKSDAKTGLLGPGNEAYDATGLVPFYTDASQVPAHLQKYFAQRTRYFSRYDEGCLLDEEGWYSVTPEAIATQIAERCRCDVILDAFCGVGGNAIAFARTCERVIALDTSPTRLALARHNAALHGLATRIEFILTDFRTFAASHMLHASSTATTTTTSSLSSSSSSSSSSPKTHSSSSTMRKIDVVFLSPPWGGPEYLSAGTEYSLARTQPEPASELFRIARLLTSNVAFYVPRNTILEDIAALLPAPATVDGKLGDGTDGAVQVQEQVEALTCYFGGLTQGQEHLF
ncbi:RNA cap guanine-N2 methyltransferase-domain-containing protein [Multifurca ochricompacta]|uniref:Trimethylguanosine synthase n=1 Tax=Multifurca ochricompacta TaxID=376703 RepID=A0AAD4QJE6_9AGAM|nr:RNA cap guanine-N2 methyltransferase-domain-containing protein [Multifurca ochricompacta]